MSELRQYAMILMTSAAIGCLLKLALPDKSIKKGISWLISLVILTAAAAPLKSMLKNFNINTAEITIESGLTEEHSYTDLLIQTSVDSIEKNLAEAIALRYGADVELFLTIDAEDIGDILITGVKIELIELRDVRKSSEIGRWVADMMGCEVEIMTEKGSEHYHFID